MASDRRGLWRLCAYGARGAVASSRLSELPDGRFAYDMKRALPDGRRQLVMTGVELLEKLVPLIPPTYANLTRFHGVFAPTSRLRDKVVPRPPSTVDGAEPPAEPQVSTTSPPPSAPAASPKSTSVPSTYRLDWASLLKRVFGVDVLKCSRCQGQMQLIACIEEPDVAKKILELSAVGLRCWCLMSSFDCLRRRARQVAWLLESRRAKSATMSGAYGSSDTRILRSAMSTFSAAVAMRSTNSAIVWSIPCTH